MAAELLKRTSIINSIPSPTQSELNSKEKTMFSSLIYRTGTRTMSLNHCREIWGQFPNYLLGPEAMMAKLAGNAVSKQKWGISPHLVPTFSCS